MPAHLPEFRVHSIQHAVGLPQSDVALKLLEQVRRHAEAVLRKRGWCVLELVELCCCKAAPEQKPASVAGWCIPAGDAKTANRIALRLRAPKGKGHGILPFEEVFGTMLHELTHIIHGKHTAAFYELMDELTKQWEQLEATGQVLDESGFPTVGGHRVDPMNHNPSLAMAKRLQATAAERRLKVNQLMGSGRLGHGTLGQVEWKRLPLREKAARAAERRAAEAALGFGPEELPNMSNTGAVGAGPPVAPASSASESLLSSASPLRAVARPAGMAVAAAVAAKRRWCQRPGCSCPAPHGNALELDSKPAAPLPELNEDSQLQEAILASLANAQSPRHVQTCIVLSDDEGDTAALSSKNVKGLAFGSCCSASAGAFMCFLESAHDTRLGKVPREKVALGTFWHLACQPPKRCRLRCAANVCGTKYRIAPLEESCWRLGCGSLFQGMEADELQLNCIQDHAGPRASHLPKSATLGFLCRHPYASLLPFLTGVPAAEASEISVGQLGKGLLSGTLCYHFLRPTMRMQALFNHPIRLGVGLKCCRTEFYRYT